MTNLPFDDGEGRGATARDQYVLGLEIGVHQTCAVQVPQRQAQPAPDRRVGIGSEIESIVPVNTLQQKLDLDALELGVIRRDIRRRRRRLLRYL